MLPHGSPGMNHRKRSPGFSLILSLTVMASIVMLLVTVSAFITVESRAALNQQLSIRAKLNSIVSMRLALAHLQQEAGPDRRSTARGDITQPDETASGLRNPMWTGVWRTDLPDLPPAWLVSGRGDRYAGTQSVSLFQTGPSADYPLGYWTPWSKAYAPDANITVPLVSRGSAAPSDGSTPDGFVSLPKIVLPDERIDGSYAYWVGDEGIKARVNLVEKRSDAASDATAMIALRSPVAQGLLKEIPIPQQLEGLTRSKDVSLLKDFDPVVTGGSPFDTRSLFHDLTLTSAGVLADSLHGGLKRDLSLAFELPDSAFAASEFGQGIAPSAAATSTGEGVASVKMPVIMDKGGKSTEATPIFSRKTTEGDVRGPTWWALRDYHRLYKNLGWDVATGTSPRATGAPWLKARALWPNVAAAHPNGTPASSGLPNNGIRNRIYGYSDVYNGDLPTPINPTASDLLNGDSGRLITRPLSVAATPYVQRVTLAFSVNKMQWFVWKSIRIGKNVMWYQEEWVDIRLNITPVVVVHNPYNVRMSWQPGSSAASGTKKPYAASVSFSELAGWKFRFKQYQSGNMSNPYVYETPLSQFFSLQSSNSDDEDTFRLYLTKDDTNKEIVFEPGELRVFSCEPVIGEWAKSIALKNTFDTRGGYRDNVWDWGFGDPATETFDINSPIAFEIIPGGSVRMRSTIACWPGDEVFLDSSPGNSDKNDFFYKNSEINEVIVTDINQAKYPSAGEKFFASWRHVRDKYPKPDPTYDGRNPYPTPTSPPLEPDLIATIDISAKTADAIEAPFPSFTHSNPLAPTQRASASGRRGLGTDMGALGASPSYQLTVRSGTWLNVLSNMDSGKLAFGGNSMGPAGSPKAILVEVPLVQPTSLAQYAHANFGVRDQQPLLGIGNSFSTPFVDASKAIQTNGPNWTDFDQNYLLNEALWDGYFLSSLAPWMKSGNGGAVDAAAPTPPDITSTTKTTLPANPNEIKPLASVINDFVVGGVPLDNPRFVLESDRDAVATTQALSDYRRASAVLLNAGAFNVNSTSVGAWQAFLGSTKKMALAGLPADKNARFPRSLGKATPSKASGNLNDPTNWNGFAQLDDAQIAALAKAIVAENKERFAIQRRSERDLVTPPGLRLFDGKTKATTPYLGLSEFINRFLAPEAWASRCGALQSAIFRADQTFTSGISDRLFSGATDRRLTEASLQSSTAGFFPNPENIESNAAKGASRTHTALAAPGNLLQSDLLQSLGSALSTRSDTFTIRCYGEAAQSNGEIGSAWMEVVVQRIPSYVDPANPAETGNSVPRPFKPAPSSATDVTLSTALTPVNNVLGRRFKVISMRWLKFDEI